MVDTDVKDPDFSIDTKNKLDIIYSELLDVYNKESYESYVDKSEAARQDIAKLNPPAPVIFRPYPKVTDAKFNEKLAVKKELNRYKLTPEYAVETSFDAIANEKCSLTDFKLSNNQKFIKNFLSPLTPYNGLLLFHSVGVGKTCTAISIAEQYLVEPDAKRVLVILSSNIKDNFKKQIFDISKYNIQTNESVLCTGTKYPDMIIDKKSITKEVLEKRINKLIKERYQFVGYKELVEITKRIMETVKKNERNPDKHEQRYQEKLKDMFSDRLIIIDEAHNLRLPSENGKKQVSNVLVNILKQVENTKLVLLSATPMYNNAKEITYMLNLLLTNDRRSISFKGAFDKDGRLTDSGRKSLTKAARGYVSFMRGENPFSYPFRIFPSINGDKNVITKYPGKDATGSPISKEDQIKYIELIGSQMSPSQKSVYESMKKVVISTEEEEEDEEEEDDERVNDLQNTLQLSNIIYPSKDYGKTGFSKCFDKREKKEVKYKAQVVKEHGEFLRYDLIDKYAPKIKTILDYIIKSEGIVFIYTQYYWAGVYPLAIALEHIGFTKYKHGSNSKNVATGITIDNKFDGKDRPSYIIVSRDKDISPNNDKEIADAKASGDKIKVIIVTKVGAEGIDFKRIREVHILEPWFNLNRIEQIIGRAIRTCSHVELPKEKRNVTVYLHACKYTDTEESIDIKTYRTAEKKQRTINEIQRLLKEGAIDCNLNISNLFYPLNKLNMSLNIITSQGKTIKNYQIGDRENSYICDYGKCEMKCSSPVDLSKSNIDKTTFDPYFIIDDIDLYKKYIAKIFKLEYQKTYEDIYSSLGIGNIEHDVLSYTLQEMVDSKYKFLNIKGRQGYLIYRGNLYIFQDAKHYETKLTLEERREMKKRSRLDFNVLRQTQKISDEVEKPKKKAVTTTTDADIYISLAQKFKDLQKLAEVFDIPNSTLLESIIDKLSFEEMEGVLTHPDSPNDFGLYDALKKSEIVILDTKGIPTHIYHHMDGSFYTITASGLKRVGPMEQAKISKSISLVEDKLKYTNDEYKGSIEFSKKNEPNFKIKDNAKTKGFVCHQTSSLTIDDLKKRLVDILPASEKILESAKYTKRSLCDIYELILRSKGPLVFKRSYNKA